MKYDISYTLIKTFTHFTKTLTSMSFLRRGYKSSACCVGASPSKVILMERGYCKIKEFQKYIFFSKKNEHQAEILVAFFRYLFRQAAIRVLGCEQLFFRMLLNVKTIMLRLLMNEEGSLIYNNKITLFSLVHNIFYFLQ